MKLLMRMPYVKDKVITAIGNQLTEAFGGNFYEIIIGGAALNRDIEEFLHRIHFRFTIGYGLTECAPIITYADWTMIPNGSCGRPVKHMQVKIDSPDPQNVPGEILCKGINVMLGY